MIDLTKSTLSYSWALAVLGLQETVRFCLREEPKGPPTTAAAAVAAPQQGLADLYKAALTNPGTAMRLGTEMLWDFAESMRFFWPDGQTMAAWRELMNKVAVYQLVRSVETKLRLPREGEFDLREYVDKAYALGPYAALWAVEGLGHDYADSVREKGGELKGLLQGERIANLPSKSLTMLHAGIGLSFAQRLMEKMNAQTPEPEIRAAVEEFIRLCRENSEPGYAGAAIESLGLVTRTFHSELTPAVDRALMEMGEDLAGFFWHGAGRATYFLLVNFLPYRNPVWRAVEMGRNAAPHDSARHNLLAGTAWALTLVNMRHPQVMAYFLATHGDDLADSVDAFTNGVESSIVMRYDTSPDDEYIEAFRNFQPEESDRRVKELWEKMVKAPMDSALERRHAALLKAGKLEEVFRFQNLDAVTGA